MPNISTDMYEQVEHALERHSKCTCLMYGQTRGDLGVEICSDCYYTIHRALTRIATEASIA